MRRSHSEREALRKARQQQQRALLASKYGTAVFAPPPAPAPASSKSLDSLPEPVVGVPVVVQDKPRLREIRQQLADDAVHSAGPRRADPQEPDIALKAIKGFGKVAFAGYKDYTEDKEYRQRIAQVNTREEVDLGKRVLETVCRDLHNGSIGEHQTFSFTPEQDRLLATDSAADRLLQEEEREHLAKTGQQLPVNTSPMPVHEVPVIEELRAGFDPKSADQQNASSHTALSTLEMDRVFGFTNAPSETSKVRHFNRQEAQGQGQGQHATVGTWTAQRRHEYLDQLVRHTDAYQQREAEEDVSAAGPSTESGWHFWRRWMQKSVFGYLPVRLKRLVAQHQYVGGLVAKFQPMATLGKQYMRQTLGTKASSEEPRVNWQCTVCLGNLSQWLRCKGLYVRNVVEDENGECLGVKCALAPTEKAKAIDPPNDIGVLTDIRLALNYTAPVFRSKAAFTAGDPEAELEERRKAVPLHLLNNRALMYLESKLSNKIDLLSSDLEVTEQSEDEEVCAFLEDCLFVKLLFRRVPTRHLKRPANTVRAQQGERVALVCFFFFIFTEEFT